jgi:uncharacterized membrane protein
MKYSSFIRALPVALALFVFVCAAGGNPREAFAAMSFCNRTSVALEAALAYRGDADDKADNWVSEGWWLIEPGQCARVYAQSLSQRFYYYYARAVTEGQKDAKPMEWDGKYIFCVDKKAFRIDGDGDCAARNFQSAGFREQDVGANVPDYTLDLKDSPAR